MSDSKFVEILSNGHHCLVRTDLIAFVEREDSGALNIYLQGLSVPIQIQAKNAMLVMQRLGLKPEGDWTPTLPEAEQP